MLVGLNDVNAKGITPMSISINTNLPCVDFQLGTGTYKTPCLRALVDSEAAMNSGNLDYHRTVMSRFLDIVAEYIEYWPGTKYDLVQLKVAVTQSGVEEKCDDGTLSAIIRYKTPYFINSHCLILSFALGKSLSLRTILGTPSLEEMHGVLDLSDKTLALKRLGITLPLVMTEPCPCFPPTTNDALQTGSLLTASKSSNDNRSDLAKGDASKFLTHPSHSSNLVVTDSWENNTLSRSVSQSRNPSAL